MTKISWSWSGLCVICFPFEKKEETTWVIRREASRKEEEEDKRYFIEKKQRKRSVNCEKLTEKLKGKKTQTNEIYVAEK